MNVFDEYTDEYDLWYDKHHNKYQSEVISLKKFPVGFPKFCAPDKSLINGIISVCIQITPTQARFFVF